MPIWAREGTFTEAALAVFDPAALRRRFPAPRIQATLDAVRSGEVERAIVPIENSVEGAVTATLDELATGPDLAICAELSAAGDVRPAGQAGHGARRTSRRSVAIPRRRRSAAAGWRRICPTQNGCPLRPTRKPRGRPPTEVIDAALAGAFAAERYGLEILASGVSDVPDAVTRFVVVGSPGPVPAATGADRTSLVAFLREDHPGALMELLTEFAVRGINLTRIESRPTGDGLGKYCFSIDCEGHLDDARVGEALMGLRRVCADVKFLGSYPRHDGGRTQVRPGTSDTEFAQAAAWLGRLQVRPGVARY